MKKLSKITLLMALVLALACPAFATAHVSGDINAGAETVTEAKQPTEKKPAAAVQPVTEAPPAPETVTEPVTEKTEPVTEPPTEAAEPETEEVTEAPTEDVTEPPLDPAAFLTDGTATVVDYAVSESGKEFYIIQTANSNSYYLVLDRDRQRDNVYLLAPVDEGDLLAFAAEKEVISGETGNPIQPVTEQPTEEVPPQPETPAMTPATMGTAAASLAVLGLAGYYLKVVKPKQEQKRQQKSVESMEFEDDGPPVNEDYPERHGERFAEPEYDEAIH